MTSADDVAAPPPVALYVHFPFCVSICPYCDFVVFAGGAARGPASRIEAVVDALVTEIGLRAPRSPGGLASVYIGGGTPSLLRPAQLERLLGAADAAFGIASGAEITLEANPGHDEIGDLAAFRERGVNRLSIGAQSLDAGELRRLGRRHSPRDVAGALHAARRAGFDNVSLDLMYDVPGQTLESWRSTVENVINLAPDHVSAYALALDDPDAEGLTGPRGDHLPLRAGARRWRDRARDEQDDDRAADLYLLADDLLGAAGLAWYEISSWSRPGRESRHNLAYWRGAAWEGVGPGAHAFDGARTRRWNAAHLAPYLAALAAGNLPPGGSAVAGEADAAADAVILRLRTRWGLPLPAIGDPRMSAALGWAVDSELLEESDGRLVLTRTGRLLSNELFARLLPEAAPAAAHVDSRSLAEYDAAQWLALHG